MLFKLLQISQNIINKEFYSVFSSADLSSHYHIYSSHLQNVFCVSHLGRRGVLGATDLDVRKVTEVVFHVPFQV